MKTTSTYAFTMEEVKTAVCKHFNIPPEAVLAAPITFSKGSDGDHGFPQCVEVVLTVVCKEG